jgi:type I restriction enzyme, S subunit
MELKPGYKQTEVGMIPEEWNIDSLSSVTPRNVRNGIVDGPFGSNLKTIHYRKSGIPIITSGYVTEGRFTADSYLYADKEKFEEEKRSAVQPGDIVMAKIGARCGASAILPHWHQTGILSGNALKITVDESRHSTFYVWQVLWDLYSSDRIGPLRTVGAQPAISMANLKEYRLPLPPLSEQRAIATALSDMDALLSKLDALIAKKRDLKQAAMQRLLTGQTRLPGFSGVWEVKRLGDVVEIVMGQSPSSSNYNAKGLGLPLIQGNADIAKRKTIKRIFTTEITKHGRCGDVLMSVRAPVGEISRAVFDVCLGRGVCAIRYINDFMYHYLIWKEPSWTRLSKGSTFDSVNSADVKALEVCLPNDATEQTAIATVLSDMDAEIAALESRRDKTRALKQGMMQELLTGRIRLI